MKRNTVIIGDARQTLARLPGASVDCVVTSPPYFLLRDYGVAGQIGLEPAVNDWVEHLRAVAAELQRVLTRTGTLWLNVGDSYSRRHRYGAPPKSLLLGPERLVLALAVDGWLVRNRIAWTKTNPRPASVRDRFSSTWEHVYLLTRSPTYYLDLDSVRVPHRTTGLRVHARPLPTQRQRPSWAGPLAGDNSGLARLKAQGRPGHVLGKNPGDSWTFPASGYRGAHFATFPERLIERPIRAGCPEQVCMHCDTPWRRSAARRLGQVAVMGAMAPDCNCNARMRPGLVLDPFMGAGTVAVVAERLGRDWLGIELNPEFAHMAEQRVANARAGPRAA